jgi:hypothetical protein
MGEWDYRTRIIPLLSSMKPGHCFLGESDRVFSFIQLHREYFKCRLHATSGCLIHNNVFPKIDIACGKER